MNDEIKAAQNAVEKAIHDFRQANDEALNMKADKGYVDTLLQEKVDKLNADIDAAMDELKRRQSDLEAKWDQQQVIGESRKAGKVGVYAAEFSKLLTAEHGRNVVVSAEDFKTYKDAFFDEYLRRGDAMRPDAAAALQVGSDPEGGYWVPIDTTGRMVERIIETSPIRRIAAVETISTDSLKGSADLDEAGSGWVGETETRSETTTPDTGEWEIFVREQYAMPKVTQKWLDDAIANREAWLIRKVSDKFSRTENTAFVSGNGEKKPRGFLTYNHGVPSATGWNVIERIPTGASGAFQNGDVLIDTVYKLKSQYREGANWVMSRATLGSVRKLKDGQNNYIWQPDFTQLQASRLLGFPVTEAEDMPAIAANSLSIAFGNFQEAYQIVDRMGIRILRDPYTTKGYVKFYATKRVGGDVVNFEAIKLIRFATAAS